MNPEERSATSGSASRRQTAIPRKIFGNPYKQIALERDGRPETTHESKLPHFGL